MPPSEGCHFSTAPPAQADAEKMRIYETPVPNHPTLRIAVGRAFAKDDGWAGSCTKSLFSVSNA